MPIYERDIDGPGIKRLGPKFEGGACKPYQRTIRVERWSNFIYYRAIFGIDPMESIMDVIEDEITVTAYDSWGEEFNSRDVVREQINRDPLTRQFFVYKSEE